MKIKDYKWYVDPQAVTSKSRNGSCFLTAGMPDSYLYDVIVYFIFILADNGVCLSCNQIYTRKLNFFGKFLMFSAIFSLYFITLRHLQASFSSIV